MDFVLRHFKPSRLRSNSHFGGRKQDMMLESCSSLNFNDSGISQTMNDCIPATIGGVVADPMQLTTDSAPPAAPPGAPVKATTPSPAIVKKSPDHKVRKPKLGSKKDKSAKGNVEEDASEATTLNESSDSSERSPDKRKKHNAESQPSGELSITSLYTSHESLSNRSAKTKVAYHEKDQEHAMVSDETELDSDGPSMSSVSVEPEELLGSRTSLSLGASRTNMGTSRSSLVQFVIPPADDQLSKSCSDMCGSSGVAASEKRMGGSGVNNAAEADSSLLDQVKPKDLLSASEHSPRLRRRDPLLSASQHRRKKDALAASSHRRRRDLLSSSPKKTAAHTTTATWRPSGQLPTSSHKRSGSSDGSSRRDGRSSRGPAAKISSHRRSVSETPVVSQDPSSNPTQTKSAASDTPAAPVETPTSTGPRRKMRNEAATRKSTSGESRATDSHSRRSSPTPKAPRESTGKPNSSDARKTSRGEMSKSAPPADGSQAKDQPTNMRGRTSNHARGDGADSEQNNPTRRRRRSTSRSRLTNLSTDPSNRLAKAEAPPLTLRTRAQRRILNKASKEEYDFDDGYSISRGMRRTKSSDSPDSSSRSVGASPLRGVGRTTSFPVSFHKQGTSTAVQLDFDNVSLPDESVGRKLERQGSGRSLCSMPAYVSDALPSSRKADRLGQCATPRPRLGRSMSARSVRSDSGSLNGCNLSLSGLSGLSSAAGIAKRRPSLSSVGSKSSAAEDMAADALSRIPRRS